MSVEATGSIGSSVGYGNLDYGNLDFGNLGLGKDGFGLGISPYGIPSGPGGDSIDRLATMLSPDSGLSKTDLASAREAVLRQLSPLDQGRMLRAFDQADAKQGHALQTARPETSGIFPMQAKNPPSTPTTTTVKKAPPPTVPEANQKTVAKAKAPDKAPAEVRLSPAVQAEIEKLWAAAATPGSTTPGEAGIIADKKSGALSVLAVGGSYDSDKQNLVGRVKILPNSTGMVFTPTIGGNAADLINTNTSVVVMQNGEKQAMLVKTDKTPKKVDANAVTLEYKANFEERRAAGFSVDDATKYANMETAQKYGLAYYEGKNGSFKRIDTSQAGKPDFQKTPPPADPNRVATANDFYFNATVDSAPKTITVGPKIEAALDASAKQSFASGKPLEQGGVILFDKKTGALTTAPYDTQTSTNGSINGQFALKDPSKQAIGGSYHTHPSQQVTLPDGTKATALYAPSALDAAGLIAGSDRLSIVRATSADGKVEAEYMMVKTDAAVASISAAQIDTRVQDVLDQLRAAGSTADIQVQYRFALGQVLKSVGVALYEGKDGKFEKMN